MTAPSPSPETAAERILSYCNLDPVGGFHWKHGAPGDHRELPLTAHSGQSYLAAYPRNGDALIDLGAAGGGNNVIVHSVTFYYHRFFKMFNSFDKPGDLSIRDPDDPDVIFWKADAIQQSQSDPWIRSTSSETGGAARRHGRKFRCHHVVALHR